MEEDGNIINEEEHSSWVSSMLVINKRKVKEKSTPPSKEWCSKRFVLTQRINLNKAHNPTPMKQAVANPLSCAVSFAYLDVCSGYWQLPVDDENSKLLTFNTPWGQYWFTRLPFYISPAPEITKGRWTNPLRGSCGDYGGRFPYTCTWWRSNRWWL